MSNEDIKLLTTDLCGRLSYGVIFQFGGKEYHLLENINYSKDDGFVLLNGLPFSDCKPYLRPMSSMTEEERNELWFLLSERRTNIELNSNGQLLSRDDVKLGFNYPCVCPQVSSEYIDFLNAHHFDYRGLIEKGLALSSPEGMYND